jgi:hypothetical protein
MHEPQSKRIRLAAQSPSKSGAPTKADMSRSATAALARQNAVISERHGTRAAQLAPSSDSGHGEEQSNEDDEEVQDDGPPLEQSESSLSEDSKSERAPTSVHGSPLSRSRASGSIIRGSSGDTRVTGQSGTSRRPGLTAPTVLAIQPRGLQEDRSDILDAPMDLDENDVARFGAF